MELQTNSFENTLRNAQDRQKWFIALVKQIMTAIAIVQNLGSLLHANCDFALTMYFVRCMQAVPHVKRSILNGSPKSAELGKLYKFDVFIAENSRQEKVEDVEICSPAKKTFGAFGPSA